MKRVLLALFVVGCGGYEKVPRVYDGKVVEGNFIPPDAYASYMRGVLAEESGDLAGAQKAFERAASDDDDPDVWARLGEVRCKANPNDKKADAAFAKAAKIDPTHAGVMAAAGRCALLRGQDEAAVAQALKGIAADPGNADLDALLVRAQARRGDATSRDRVIAITKEHGERVVAWDAMIAWARGRHDGQLLAQGLIGLLQVAPIRSAEVEAGARELLGNGEKALAQSVAVAIADSRRDLEIRGPKDPVVARLAVDEALARGDRTRASLRATRGRVDLSEVAARAALLGHDELAKAIAAEVLAGNPADANANALVNAPANGNANVDAAVALFMLARGGARLAHAPMTPGDPLLGPLALDLVARGSLDATELAPDQRIELAARRNEAPPALPGLDARHELLRLALTAPRSAQATALFAQLAPNATQDPVIAHAIARIARVSSAPKALAYARQAAAGSADSFARTE